MKAMNDFAELLKKHMHLTKKSIENECIYLLLGIMGIKELM